jgi:hypothetical protein
MTSWFTAFCIAVELRTIEAHNAIQVSRYIDAVVSKFHATQTEVLLRKRIAAHGSCLQAGTASNMCSVIYNTIQV